MGGQLSTRINEDDIKREVAEHPIVIYTKENCSYCKQAKELLNKDRLKFKEHDLDSMALISPDKYQSYINGLVYLTRQTTVPQIFICGKFIGGYTELNQLRYEKKLSDLLNECRNWS
uniref:Glutaredoxin domain-containing protein n=1 Tax=Acrobeloides nanus TaxID=290746 RepID=A0A914CAM0_9BILA